MSVGTPIYLDSIDITLDPAELEKRPPFSRWLTSPSAAEMKASVDRLADAVSDSSGLRGVYRIDPVAASSVHASKPPQPLVSGTYLIVGLLALAESSSPEDCIETRIDKLVWDALENAMLQLGREKMLQKIRADTMERGLNTTRVYAPGARDENWPLERRQFIFEALPTERIGVSAGDSGIVPRKTFTFAIGAGPDIEQADLLISCEECEIVETCVYAGSATTV